MAASLTRVLSAGALLLFTLPLAAEVPCHSVYGFPRVYDSSGSVTLHADDVDGDGHADLVASGYGVSISYGRGDGSLEPPVKLLDDYGYTTRAFVTDMNADGRADIGVMPGHDPRVIYVRFNRGWRRFSEPVEIFRGGGFGPLVADLTNDDAAEFLTYGTFGQGHALHLNDGRGGFVAKATPVSLGERAAATGDLNGDGYADLVTYDKAGILRAYRGDGTGSFTEQAVLESKTNAHPKIVDLNGDEMDDVLSLREGSGKIAIYYGPSPSARSVVVMETVPHPRNLVSGDFDNDGSLDIAVAGGTGEDVSGPRVIIHLNDGHGNLERGATIPLSNMVDGIAAADFNGDGVLDLALPSWQYGSAIAVGGGDGTFRAVPYVATRPIDTRLEAAADFDADGIDELILHEYFGDRAVYAGWLDANGGYTYDRVWNGERTAAGALDAVSGDELLILRDRKIRVFSNSSHDRWRIQSELRVDAEIEAMAIIGVSDSRGAIALISTDTTTVTLNIISERGEPLFRSEIRKSDWDYTIFAADVDNDHNGDVIVAGSGPGSYLTLFRGRGDGSFDAAEQILSDLRIGGTQAGRFSGGAALDLYVQAGDEAMMLINDGRGRFTRRLEPSIDLAGWGAAADFDGDSFADIVAWPELTLHRGGPGGFTRAGTVSSGSGPTWVAARRRPNAPPSMLQTSARNAIVAADVVCPSPRRRGVRH